MSATERDPAAVRDQRRVEMELLIAQARQHLQAIRDESADMRRRIDRHLRGPRRGAALRFLLGVIAFPFIALMGLCLTVPLCELLRL